MTLAPLFAASFAIQLHTAAAVLAAVSGCAVLFMRKGTQTHRTTGYVFTAAMAVTAVSSFWIMEVRRGQFSAIHILSIITLISLPLAIWYRRKGNIRAHAAAMIGPLIGLIVAGGFTLLPGRILHQAVFAH